MVKLTKKKTLKFKKFFQNRYFIFRHGHSSVQIENIIGRPSEDKNYGLTIKGREEVSISAKKIKKESIDLIISSDSERARQTSEIISRLVKADVFFDKRLREFDAGDFNGFNPEKIWKYLREDDDFIFSVFPNGESIGNVRHRIYDCLIGLEKKHKDKTIIIVSHEFPLMLLEWTLKGMEIEEIIESRCSGKIKKINTGDFCELCFQNSRKEKA